MKEVNIYTDGGSRNNPGPAAIGILICDKDNKILTRYGEFIGENTNNTAEYTAILKSFDILEDFSPSKIQFFSDSQLVVRQMNGEYKIKKKHLQELAEKIRKKLKKYEEFEFIHVGRENEYISKADTIVNKVLDNLGPGNN